jgi:lysozyme
MTTVPPAVIAALVPVLRDAEGCRLQAYQDSAGVWTIGWGHTGPEIVYGLVWTQQQADAQLGCDLSTHYAELISAFSGVTSLTPERQAALLDFVYNEGVGRFQSSTLLKVLQAGQLDDVPTQLMRWDEGGGQVLEGLVQRRKAECALWSLG